MPRSARRCSRRSARCRLLATRSSAARPNAIWYAVSGCTGARVAARVRTPPTKRNSRVLCMVATARGSRVRCGTHASASTPRSPLMLCATQNKRRRFAPFVRKKTRSAAATARESETMTASRTDAAKAIKTYLDIGDATALDALPQSVVIDYVTHKSRPLQTDHGSKANDTAAAHRMQHARACEMVRERANELDNRDVVKVMAVVDRDLRMGTKKWNDSHSNIERAEKKARETGALPMNKKTGVTQSAVLARNFVRSDQVKTALDENEISSAAARVWLDEFARPLTSGDVSPLAAWKEC